jgi:hypothetical protein
MPTKKTAKENAMGIRPKENWLPKQESITFSQSPNLCLPAYLLHTLQLPLQHC